MKICSKCLVSKELSEFHRSCNTQDRLHTVCKPCRVSYVYGKQKEDRIAFEDTRMKRIYGVSFEEYERLFTKQNRVCAICHKSQKRNRLHLDHCHKSGRIRGLLCVPCNIILGRYNDDPKVFYRAIKYLEITK